MQRIELFPLEARATVSRDVTEKYARVILKKKLFELTGKSNWWLSCINKHDEHADAYDFRISTFSIG